MVNNKTFRKPVRCMDDLPFQVGEFVRQYLIDYDGTAAAKRAGYKEETASAKACELLNRKDVLMVMEQEKERRLQESVRGEQDVLRDIQDVGKEARQKGDLKSALRALELEGKHYCMFTEKVQAEVSGTLEVHWEE